MTNFYHISLQKPSDNPTGGVATFAAYLKRAVPEIECIGFTDYPDHKKLSETWKTHYDWAFNMNTWALSTGMFGADSVVVCDGYWGYGLPEEVEELLVPSYGTVYIRGISGKTYYSCEIIDRDTDCWAET